MIIFIILASGVYQIQIFLLIHSFASIKTWKALYIKALSLSKPVNSRRAAPELRRRGRDCPTA